MSSQITSVFTCDRCGREETQPADTHASQQDRPLGWTRVERMDLNPAVDLCRDCREALNAFMRGESPDPLPSSPYAAAGLNADDIPF